MNGDPFVDVIMPNYNKAEFLEETINSELQKVTIWLHANKLTLNVTKSNYIIFKTPQKKIRQTSLKINNT